MPSCEPDVSNSRGSQGGVCGYFVPAACAIVFGMGSQRDMGRLACNRSDGEALDLAVGSEVTASGAVRGSVDEARTGWETVSRGR